MVKPNFIRLNENVVSISKIREERGYSSSIGVNAEQLELLLDAPEKVYFLCTNAMHGAVFLRSLIEIRPCWIVDLRFAPHFDFTATSSLNMNAILSNLKINYTTYPLAFHQMRKEFLRYEPLKLAEAAIFAAFRNQKPYGSLLFLIQHQEDAAIFAPFISGKLENATNSKWDIGFIVHGNR